jgi:uncharacterized protein (DUF1697 family)
MPKGTVFIVLFRGVGGKTQLPTAPLRKALSGAGFGQVATYINSGNAVLLSTLGREETRRAVMDIAARDFGFDKAVHLATAQEWEDLIAQNPFPHALAEPRFLHAAWLEDAPTAENVARVRSLAAAGEDFEVRGRVAYLYTPNGFGVSKMAERFDRAIGVENTARNWNTVLRLSEMASKAGA